jgi:beta-glucosidase
MQKIHQLTSNLLDSIPELDIHGYNWANEALHGIAYAGDPTIFPQSIALAATWNPSTMKQVANAISSEGRILFNRGKIGLNYWSPNINIARDPRWGRAQETYGEDPFLTSQIGVAFIKGMQGDDSVYFKTIASPKHFLAHSGPESIRHNFNSIVSQKDLYETYAPAFKAAITKGKAYSIMAAYNALNGTPMVFSKSFLTDLLRKEWGFDGFVVSDCGAMEDAIWNHWKHENIITGSAKILKAGLDLDCQNNFYYHLPDSFAEKLLTDSDLDSAVSRLLKARYRLGILGNSKECPYTNIPDSLYNSQTHLDIAKKAAQESIVLLKNDGVLPLPKDNVKILLIGPFGDSMWEFFGNYSGWNDKTVRLKDALLKKLGKNSELICEKACEAVSEMTLPMSSEKVKTEKGEKGFKAEFFNNSEFKGAPIYTRIDTCIDFDWGAKAPIDKIQNNTYSIRWTGYFTPERTAMYTFRIHTSSAGILYIDDKLFLDDHWAHIPRDVARERYLQGGKTYKLTFDFTNVSDLACARLELGDSLTVSQVQLDSIAKKAKWADYIIFAGGIHAGYENENNSVDCDGFYLGDKTNLDLPRIQLRFLKELKKSGKPIIFDMMNGSPMSINWENDNLNAIVETWYGGQVGAHAVADVIFGDYNPGGRLPYTFYKSVNDLPEFTNYSMKGRTYKYFDGEVLYPFGYGLSYTKFEYSDISISKDKYLNKTEDSISVSFKIKNIGSSTGDEVAQLYLSKPGSSNFNAFKQLFGFSRINLKPNQDSIITFKISPADIFYYDTLKHKQSTEDGIYSVQIGASSQDIKLVGKFEIDTPDVGVVDTQNEISIYPTPSSEYLEIESKSGAADFGNISIFTLDGQELSVNEEYRTNKKIIINVMNFNDGAYALRIGKNIRKIFFVLKK